MKSILSDIYEQDRLAVLDSYGIMDSQTEPAFDNLVSLAASIYEMPMAAISFLDGERQWFKAAVGLSIREGARAESFCTHVIQQAGVFVVSDASKDDRFKGVSFVTDAPRVRFYAGTPLISEEGEHLGSLCVMDSVPREWDPARSGILEGLARQVMALVENRRTGTHGRNAIAAKAGELKIASLKLTAVEAEDETTKGIGLRMEHHLLEQVVNSLPGIFYLFDEAGQFLRWNRNLESVFGMSAEDISEHHPLDLIAASDRPAVANFFRRVFDEGEAEIEAVIIDRDKKKCPHLLTGRRIDFDGQPAVIGMAIDISQQKQAEAQFQAFMKKNPALAWMKDAAGRYVYVNETFADAYRVTPESAIGKTDAALLPKAIAARMQMKDEAVLETGEAIAAVERLPSSDGIERSWRFWRFPFQSVEGENLVGGLGFDITERVLAEVAVCESEERYRNLVEDARDAIFTLGSDGTITSLNHAFEGITGWQLEDWVGQAFHPLIDSKDTHRATEIFLQVLKGDIPSSFELRIKSKDGESIPMEFSVTAQRQGNEITGVLGIGRDVRERRQLEEKLRQIQKLDSVGRLAAGVAHDFNNLLSVQQGCVSLLKATCPLTKEGTGLIDQISAAAERAAALTRQLLLFSREQAVDPQVINVVALVESLANMLRRILRENIRLDVDCDESITTIKADPGMIEQALMNLAVNARDAMPEGGVLGITVDQTVIRKRQAAQNALARPGRFVRISVSDTGIGISPLIRERLFEPFFTTKEAGQGTGLGLPTVHGIIKKHDGWVELESEPFKGSRFTIYLPALVESVPAVKAEIQSLDTGAACEEPAFAKGETILVVEDEKSLRQVTAAVLEQRGYRVLSAENAEEALAIWEKEGASVDLLLTDLIMPGSLNGRDLAERLREKVPQLKVVFTSGYNADLAWAEQDDISGSAFLQKPFLSEALAETIRGCLNS